MTTAIELTGNEEHFVKIRKYVDQIMDKKEKYSILDGGGLCIPINFYARYFLIAKLFLSIIDVKILQIVKTQ